MRGFRVCCGNFPAEHPVNKLTDVILELLLLCTSRQFTTPCDQSMDFARTLGPEPAVEFLVQTLNQLKDPSSIAH